MDEPTLEGCSAKVDRAAEQMESLAHDWLEYLGSNPWPSRVDSLSDPGWHRIFMDFSAPAPPRFSIVVGEVAHDLRSALDHLAWREAVECVGPQQAESHAAEIGFPLTSRPRAFRAAKVVNYVSSSARGLIEHHQPYASKQDSPSRSLGLLQWFNNRDKHRTIQVAAIGAPSLFTLDALKITFARGARLHTVQPRLQLGEQLLGERELARVRFHDGGPDPKVQMHRTPPFSPSFGEPPEALRGVEIFHTIAHVREVIADFETLLPDG